MPKRQYKPRNDDLTPCNCGTGTYCHRHRQYGLPESLYHSVESKYMGCMTEDRIRDCGGGRRVSHTEPGDT